MLIEITGAPGSGKSSICRIIGKKLDNVIFVSRYNNILYEIMHLAFYLSNYENNKKYNIIFSLILKSNNTVFHKLNIIRNVIKKLSINAMLKPKKEIYLFDEGVSHIPFNIFVDSSSIKHCKLEIINLIDLLPSPDLLLLINASKNKITNRLKNRGHNRIDLNDNEKTKIFISKSLIVRDQIINYYKNNNKKYKIINNNDSIDNAVTVAKNIVDKCYV